MIIYQALAMLVGVVVIDTRSQVFVCTYRLNLKEKSVDFCLNSCGKGGFQTAVQLIRQVIA